MSTHLKTAKRYQEMLILEERFQKEFLCEFPDRHIVGGPEARPGDIAVFMATAYRSPDDQKHAQEIGLEDRQHYFVVGVDVGSFYTRIRLAEFSDHSFNSVLFDVYQPYSGCWRIAKVT